MAKIVNVHEAKTLLRILDEVRSGAEFILAKDGVPYARLVPLVPPASAASDSPRVV